MRRAEFSPGESPQGILGGDSAAKMQEQSPAPTPVMAEATGQTRLFFTHPVCLGNSTTPHWEKPSMLALIFSIQAISLILILRKQPRAAIGCFWVGLVMTLLWFNHHATESLGFAF